MSIERTARRRIRLIKRAELLKSIAAAAEVQEYWEGDAS